jgi:hypothetical protein
MKLLPYRLNGVYKVRFNYISKVTDINPWASHFPKSIFILKKRGQILTPVSSSDEIIQYDEQNKTHEHRAEDFHTYSFLYCYVDCTTNMHLQLLNTSSTQGSHQARVRNTNITLSLNSCCEQLGMYIKSPSSQVLMFMNEPEKKSYVGYQVGSPVCNRWLVWLDQTLWSCSLNSDGFSAWIQFPDC